MGPVSQALRDLVKRQVDQHGVVVWYDPGGTYAGLLPQLALPSALTVTYAGSFFSLRREIEGALDGQQPPRLLVYVPLPQEGCHDALVEVEAAGVVMRPGQQPPSRNTRLAVVARNALSGLLAADHIDSVIRHVEEGKLSLSELDALAGGSGGTDSALVTVLFGTTNPVHVALRLLTDPGIDEEIAKKNAAGDLAHLFERAFEAPVSAATSVSDLRQRLSRSLLVGDLMISLGPREAEVLPDVPTPARRASVDAIRETVQTFRNRRDLQASYVELAGRIEESVDLDLAGCSVEELARVETFRSVELALQLRVQGLVLHEASPSLLDLAVRRQDAFWATVDPSIMDRWALLAAVLRVLVGADEVSMSLARVPAEAGALARAYVGQDAGDATAWCALDAAFRNLERRYRVSEAALSDEGGQLEALVARARQVYAQTVETVAERMTELLVSGSFVLPGIVPQRRVFADWIEPALRDGPVAYVLVDGLRYEMGRELYASLGEGLEVELAPCAAQVPTVTEVGMAALLPFAHHEVALVAGGPGKLALEINGTRIAARADRVRAFEALQGSSCLVLKLDQLLPTSAKVRKAIAEARLVVITATDELDGLCESANTAMAHRLMDDVLVQLRRCVRGLLDLGVDTVVVTADHGFLLGLETESGQKMDPPGGDVVDLHPRLWVGRGGSAAPGYVRFHANQAGLAGDLEIALPLGLSCFKGAGARSVYFHGGASPQELFVPLIRVRRSGVKAATGGEIDWQISLGSRFVTSPFVSVQIAGEASSLFDITPLVVRVEVREGKKLISRPLSAAYGFDEATGDVAMEVAADAKRLRGNTVVLRLDPLPASPAVSVVLVDARNDARLQALPDVPVRLAGF